MEKPQTRQDCLEQGLAVTKVCPFVTCKYHLLLENRKIVNRINVWERFVKYKGRWVWLDVPITDDEIINKLMEMEPRHTCSLEMASWGPVTLEEISRIP
jgi:hypothetical protein